MSPAPHDPGASAQPPLVFDTSTLSCFARAGRLELLAQLVAGRACVVTEAVIAEIRAGARLHPRLGEVLAATWLTPVRVERATELFYFATYRAVLGSTTRNIGEASTLAWAEERRAVAFLDDDAAVMAARRRGVQVRRTLALVASSVASGTLSRDDAERLVDDLIEIGGARFPCNGATFARWAEEHGLL